MAAHPDSIDFANTLSDHNAQIDKAAKVVSQNLQGPYAIMLSGRPPKWTFDLPEPIDLINPNYGQLSKMTGLSVAQCKQLVHLMTQQPTISKEIMSKELGKLSIGDFLGQGGHRISIETDKVYETRMHVQIGALSASVDGGANVLSLQEQPYDGIDQKRMKIFEKVMKECGYVSVARLEGRDVGIWVKRDLYHNFKEPSDKSLVKMVADDPFRGCVVEDNGYLYINLHAYTRGMSMDELIDKLIVLKLAAENYANQQRPKLNIAINGDMNLFMLAVLQQNRLKDVGFVVELVKGQESYEKSTCEAYLLAESHQRGQVLFIRATNDNSMLTAAIYKELLVSGQCEGFELMDQNGNRLILGEKGDIRGNVFGYPGNEGQVLENKKETDPNQWKYKTLKSVQEGNGLARIASELISSDGCALPLPTAFYTFGTDLAGRARREQLATRQMQQVDLLLDQGFNIVFYVKPHERNNGAFNDDHFVAQQGDIKYDLAFWGGNQNADEYAYPLAAIYANGVKKYAIKNEQEISPIRIDYSELWTYMSKRERSLNPFSYFGDFTEAEKMVAVAKLIRAIIHYNFYGSMEGFQEEQLTAREIGALGQGDLKTAVDATLGRMDGNVKVAILNSIFPKQSAPSP